MSNKLRKNIDQNVYEHHQYFCQRQALRLTIGHNVFIHVRGRTNNYFVNKFIGKRI